MKSSGRISFQRSTTSLRLGEEAVAADVEQEALVAGGAADAADIGRIGLDHGDGDALLGQQIGGGQAGGSGADDEHVRVGHGFNLDKQPSAAMFRRETRGCCRRRSPPSPEQGLTVGRKAEEFPCAGVGSAGRRRGAVAGYRLRAPKARRVGLRRHFVLGQRRCRCWLRNRSLPRLPVLGRWAVTPLGLGPARHRLPSHRHTCGPRAVALRLARRHRTMRCGSIAVRELLAGAPWFDTTLPRIGAPEPLLSHWSRLIDAAARDADRPPFAAARAGAGRSWRPASSGPRCCSSRWP